jgi:hypothetical protein
MTRFSKLVLGLIPALTAVACYNTASVDNGGLACGTGNTCPEGFSCRSDGRCWKNGTGPGACNEPFGPFATCSSGQGPANSTCDPVCQSGCACDRRCVLDPDTASRFVCETSTRVGSFVGPGQTCEDADACAPGSVCIADAVCPNLCYKTCRADVDCPAQAFCTRTTIEDPSGRLLTGVFLCSPPIETCSPTGAAACSPGRAGSSCVFLAGLTGVAISDATVCDCSTLHTERVGSVCATAPDNCEPGAVCVDGRCRTICNRSGSGVTCPSGSSCVAIYDSAVYGYCR